MLKVTIVNAVYPTEPDWSHANRWLTVILIDPEKFVADTHAIREALERENIEARPVWKPMHLQPVFGECRVRSAGFGVETGGEAEVRVQRSEVGAKMTVSEELFAKGLCLPSGTAMTDADIQRVAEVVRQSGRL